ncbi:MAG: DUF5011 domain-containing protein [Sphingobacteriales bacterium]|nr:MAG: DUF5011 domain-containing protein [Sphingobacteriales bacterium]
MKKLLIILLALSPAIFYTSCKKDETVSKVVNVSFPSIKLNGEKYVTLNVGQTYDDPGAVSTDDISGATANLKADYSSLDVNTPGIYYMQYKAKNANGYITNVGRYIAVTNYQDDFDFSGVYERTSNGVQVNITKVSRGLYMTDDMGGAGLPDAAYFAIIDNSTIDFGPQLSESIGAEIDASGETVEIDGTDVTIQYALSAAGYGTAPRTFVRVQ